MMNNDSFLKMLSIAVLLLAISSIFVILNAQSTIPELATKYSLQALPIGNFSLFFIFNALLLCSSMLLIFFNKQYAKIGLILYLILLCTSLLVSGPYVQTIGAAIVTGLWFILVGFILCLLLLSNVTNQQLKYTLKSAAIFFLVTSIIGIACVNTFDQSLPAALKHFSDSRNSYIGTAGDIAYLAFIIGTIALIFRVTWIRHLLLPALIISFVLVTTDAGSALSGLLALITSLSASFMVGTAFMLAAKESTPTKKKTIDVGKRNEELRALYASRPSRVKVGIIVLAICHTLAYVTIIVTTLKGMPTPPLPPQEAIIIICASFGINLLALIGLYFGSSIAFFFTYTLQIVLFILYTFLLLFVLIVKHNAHLISIFAERSGCWAVYLIFFKFIFYYKASKQWFKDIKAVRKSAELKSSRIEMEC